MTLCSAIAHIFEFRAVEGTNSTSFLAQQQAAPPAWSYNVSAANGQYGYTNVF